MKQFEYQARLAGQDVAGQLTAKDLAAAQSQLEALGYEALLFREIDEQPAASSVAANARLPLPVVLEALAEDLNDSKLRRAVTQLTKSLEAGSSLDEALASLPDTTPRYLRGVLSSATTGDELASVCDNFTRLRQSASDAWVAIRRLLFYPTLLLAALVGLGFIVGEVVAPAFASIFDEFDLELPPMTDSLLFAGPYLPWLVLVLLCGWLAVVLGPRLFRFGHPLQTALPALGSVFVSVSHEQFAGTLANFLRMRLPLPQALQYTGDLLEDRSLARATYRAADAVEHGTSLATSMARCRQFDRMLTTLVHWGEQRSNLAESLEIAASMFFHRRQQRLQLVHRIAPPLVMVFVAGSASAVASALMLPLIKLIEGLS